MTATYLRKKGSQLLWWEQIFSQYFSQGAQAEIIITVKISIHFYGQLRLWKREKIYES